MANSIQELIRSLNDGVNTYPPIRHSRPRRRAKGRSRKFLKSWTWDVTDGFPPNIMKGDSVDNENIFLGVSDFEDLVSSKVLKERSDQGLSTVQRETTVLCNRSTWKAWAEKYFKEQLYTQPSSSSGLVLSDLNLVKFDVNSNTTTVRCFGDETWAASVIKDVEESFSVVTSYIEWIYSSDGGSVNVPLNRDRLPVAEMYPFLKGESLESYYDRYMNSSANILLLIGPPGTGKTTFIRGLLSHRNCSAIVTYDASILEKDGFFARFIEDDSEVMVLEDSDAFLKSRSDGNTMMHRFLNVGDGLVTTKGKKMIFSTNLPSIRDIDSALIRPGRCFDILTFDQLQANEAQVLADKLGVTLPEKNFGDKYSIAEIFNEQTHSAEKAVSNRRVGFL
jgi:hypothetical protein